MRRWYNRMRKRWSWREFSSGSHRLTKTSLESMVRVVHVSVRAHRLDRPGRTWNCTSTMRSHIMKWPFRIWWGGYIICNVQWSSYFNIVAVMSFRVVRGRPANSSTRSIIVILRRFASSSHHFNSVKCLFDIIFLSRKRDVKSILQEEITFSVNFIRGRACAILPPYCFS